MKRKKDISRNQMLLGIISFILFFIPTTIIAIKVGDPLLTFQMAIWVVVGYYVLLKLIRDDS